MESRASSSSLRKSSICIPRILLGIVLPVLFCSTVSFATLSSASSSSSVSSSSVSSSSSSPVIPVNSTNLSYGVLKDVFFFLCPHALLSFIACRMLLFFGLPFLYFLGPTFFNHHLFIMSVVHSTMSNVGILQLNDVLDIPV